MFIVLVFWLRGVEEWTVSSYVWDLLYALWLSRCWGSRACCQLDPVLVSPLIVTHSGEIADAGEIADELLFISRWDCRGLWLHMIRGEMPCDRCDPVKSRGILYGDLEVEMYGDELSVLVVLFDWLWLWCWVWLFTVLYFRYKLFYKTLYFTWLGRISYSTFVGWRLFLSVILTCGDPYLVSRLSGTWWWCSLIDLTFGGQSGGPHIRVASCSVSLSSISSTLELFYFGVVFLYSSLFTYMYSFRFWCIWVWDSCSRLV